MPVTRLTLLFVLFATLAPATASAATYRYTDEDGTVWLTNHKATHNGAVHYAPMESLSQPMARVNCLPKDHAGARDRVTQLAPIVYQYARQYGVDDGLIHAIISIESCYDRTAVSRAGAQGLMQLMPATAKSLGVVDPFNPHENLRAGIRYFSELSKRFNYNYRLALAAYNAGPTAVEKYAAIPPYPETQAYVAKVLQRYRENLTQPVAFVPLRHTNTAD